MPYAEWELGFREAHRRYIRAKRRLIYVGIPALAIAVGAIIYLLVRGL